MVDDLPIPVSAIALRAAIEVFETLTLEHGLSAEAGGRLCSQLATRTVDRIAAELEIPSPSPLLRSVLEAFISAAVLYARRDAVRLEGTSRQLLEAQAEIAFLRVQREQLVQQLEGLQAGGSAEAGPTPSAPR